MIILFIDIVGFIVLLEYFSVEEMVVFLNDYFVILVEVVEGEGGMVDKFIGDGMLVFWGVLDVWCDYV